MSFCFSHRAVKLFKARFSWNFPNTSIKLGSIERKANEKKVLKAKTEGTGIHWTMRRDFNAACTFPLCFGMFINCMITSVNQHSNRRKAKTMFCVSTRRKKREWNWKELFNINFLCANEDLFVAVQSVYKKFVGLKRCLKHEMGWLRVTTLEKCLNFPSSVKNYLWKVLEGFKIFF